MSAGPLYAKRTGTASAPITIAAYGEGDKPLVRGHDAQGNVVKITGSYQVLGGLRATTPPAADLNCGCQVTAGSTPAICGHAAPTESEATG
jgi:hypothetical protein